ncbi:MAG: FtsX-like permease family protein [Phycisphaerae bacterium]|nr:FtsX-like permease family protein [Phycisphaerae bacterium]
MSVIWLKVWSDLWDNKVRTFLAVLSIAAGVFAIGAIFGMVDQLTTGMDTAHQATVPSHIQMFLTGWIERDTALRLKRIEGVDGIEVLNDVTVRYKIDPDDEWRRGQLGMRDDFENQKYDILELKQGEWPKKNHIGIERLSSQFYGIDIGDKIIFELDKTDRALPITNKIRHPFVPPPQFGGDAYFIVDAQGLERFNVPKGKFGQLKVRVKPYSLELAKEVASEIKVRLGKEGIGVAATFYQDPNEHWGRFFIDGFNLVLQIMALTSVFTSVILVFNTVTAVITQQTNQIGVIKAIGGRTGNIIKIYLAGVLVFGLLALLISLPIGAFLAFGMSQYFLNLFNIDYEVFQFSTRAIIFQILAAIAAPLIVALWPVLNGATITVREAIASYGLGGAGEFGDSRFDRLIERLGRSLLSASYAMALGNMFRRKGRLALTQMVLITAGAMFLLVMSLSASITFTLDNVFARNNFDISLVFDENYRLDQTLAIAGAVEGVEQAEMWFTQPASILKTGQRIREAGLGAELDGLPTGSDFFKPLIVAGRWLQPGDGRAIVMNQETAKENNINLGDVITLDLGALGDDEWQVIGFYRIIFGGSFSTDAIYAPLEAVFQATTKHNEGSVLRVRTLRHTAAYQDLVRNQLVNLYTKRNMDVFFNQTASEERQNADSQFSIITSMLLALAIIVAVVGGIGLMGSLSISVIERIREIGVMRAIGARSLTLMGMFVMEGVLQGIFSWLMAIPISFLLAETLSKALGQVMFEANLDYQYNYMAVLVWLAIILGISILASLLPARNAIRISVRQSLQYY